jgi:hypothetical protein
MPSSKARACRFFRSRLELADQVELDLQDIAVGIAENLSRTRLMTASKP